MFNVLSRRLLAVAAASVAFMGLTTACSAVDTAATCSEATKILQDYTSQVTSNIGDLDAVNKANKEMSDKFKALASQADGELATVLNDVATSFDTSLDADSADPNAALEFGKNAQEALTKLGKACS
ncbi:hypothetical protein [Thermostaphylospora chromogena]|uniref:Small secreted protein n=1 Tax=Thermostaphylospora chromogena TaxID=35622 RepID=A0A1H0ZXI3_9ACTN|nr:hypothetical protein [Thermostaphylospora chromogena]SDQ32165.1 hypothetical protein SAMN04489764_0202 [Thermostaphylospora chromogena]